MSRESATENKVGVLARENVSRLYWHLNENAADTAIKTTRDHVTYPHIRTLSLTIFYLNTVKINQQSVILKSKHSET